MDFSKLDSEAAILISAFLLCIAYLDILHFSSSLIYDDEFSSLPIYFEKFFFCPLYYSSSILDCWAAQILIAWNIFHAFSFDLRANLTRLKYSVLTLFFICSWQILLILMMPKYL